MRYKLPVQEVPSLNSGNKTTVQVKEDFEPIIIEEVFLNGRLKDNEMGSHLNCMTP